MQPHLTVEPRGRWFPLALILAGAGAVAVALAADVLNLGSMRGIGPRQVALALSGVAIALSGVVQVSPAGRRHIGEWLLVVMAVIAVAFAADLLVVNGLPQPGAKHIVLASAGLGVLWIGAIPAWPADRRTFGAWVRGIPLDRTAAIRFLGIVAQLALLILVVRQFRLENQALYHNVMLLAFYGFLIHSFLPSRYRLPFFALLSLAAIAGILGVANAAWLIAIGLGLAGLCHLPVPYPARVAMLLAAGAGLAALRAGWVRAPWLDVIWPVLASMFMFRLIVYLYDLRHGKARPTLASTLAYFFLLPNVVFPFYPIVDYAAFRRTYYDDDPLRIYQTGVEWMLRGVIHLLVYRFVNYHLMTAPGEVTNSAELARYLVVNFALYLRISGQFHLIVGLLHLFGFNLPETHHLYFLSTGFIDLWRRINIYWTGFMMKVVFYPTYFKIRQWGAAARLSGSRVSSDRLRVSRPGMNATDAQAAATSQSRDLLGLIAATCVVFLLTWFLHAYQWFWLRGSFLLTGQDILFWFLLALLVVANMLLDARRGQRRTSGQRAWSVKDIAGRAFLAAGTFSLMAVLWALWSSGSIGDWLGLLSVVEARVESVAALLLAFLLIATVFGLALWIESRPRGIAGRNPAPPAFARSSAVTGGLILLLLLLGNPAVHARLGGEPERLLRDLTVNRLSEREAALLQRGYYEDLTGVGRFNSGLWEIYSKRPSDWPALTETEAARYIHDDLILELVPSTTIDFHGARLSTNRWGMRDRDYEQFPAPGTYRIALTGPSFVMGFGVADGEGFEPLLEDRLNRERAGGPHARYEILNFAVPGYSAIQDLMVLEKKALSFQPNALFFMAHQREEEAVVLFLADRISVGADLPYDELMAVARRAGAEPGETKVEAERRLRPVGSDLVAWTYRRIVEVARANGIVPVWIFMPTLEDPLREEEVTHLARLAEEAGFIVVDLSDAYEGQDEESLVIALWDKHPNAKGHALIADRLYESLRGMREEIPLFR